MKKLFYILLIFFCFGCIIDKNVKPKNLISENKMIDILYDMSLISVSKGINKRILENNGMKPKKYILKKHSIDSLQFVFSNEYYSKNLETYLSIYDKVLKRLEENRESIIDSIENYKKDRAKRSKEIKFESSKNKNNSSKLNLSSDLNSNILEN